MESRKLAKLYEQEVSPGWEDRFVPFLLEAFPAQLPPKCTLLELGCTTGRLTKEILARIPAGGRLIAVEDNRELMELARLRVADTDKRKVFFKKESPEALSFADTTFDGVLSPGLPTLYDPGKVICQAARLLRPDGFLLLGAALQGSFQELLDVFREILEKEDLIPTQAALDTFCRTLPDRAAANRLLSDAGFIGTKVRQREETLRFENGLALLQSPLVRQNCLEGCLGLIRDRGWREGVLAGMVRSLDTYFPSGIELTLVLGRLEGSKA
jgi:SAM-dependent methyltransferase